MTHYVQRGNIITVNDSRSMQVHERLPAGLYTVGFNPMAGFFLEGIEPFTLPPKFYGSLVTQRDRVISTFLQRESSTGLILNGEKGSGKTLLAKAVANHLISEHNIACLVINTPYTGDSFNKFLQDIKEPCMVLFDEFEKVFNPAQQMELLTTMDGVYPSRKLFALTCNDKFKVNEHMRNRPGRLFYMLDFSGLERQFVEEYCVDQLKTALHTHIPTLITVAESFKEKFNFDMLKAIIEEMNRYNEEPRQALRWLNVKADPYSEDRYKIFVFTPDNVPLDPKFYDDRTMYLNPASNFGISINYRPFVRAPRDATPEMLKEIEARNDELEKEEVYISFSHIDFKRVDNAKRAIVLQNEDGYTCHLVKDDHYRARGQMLRSGEYLGI